MHGAHRERDGLVVLCLQWDEGGWQEVFISFRILSYPIGTVDAALVADQRNHQADLDVGREIEPSGTSCFFGLGRTVNANMSCLRRILRRKKGHELEQPPGPQTALVISRSLSAGGR